MRLPFLLLLLLYFTAFGKDFNPFLSFSSSKSQLTKLYSQNKNLPLSGLHYIFDEQSCAVDGFVHGMGNEPEKILWRHLVNETVMGEGMACMQKKLCLSSFSGRYFKGPMCCRKSSPKFSKMSADMHNIIPTVLKEAKSNLLSVNKITQKGRIARIVLYMHETYGLSFTSNQIQRYKQWHFKYPVSSFERALNRQIFELQGTFNPYVEKL